MLYGFFTGTLWLPWINDVLQELSVSEVINIWQYGENNNKHETYDKNICLFIYLFIRKHISCTFYMLYKTVFGNKFVLHELKKTWALHQTSHFVMDIFFLSVKYHWKFCMVMYLISLCIPGILIWKVRYTLSKQHTF
jgi:hypothetical protein